MEQRKMYLKKHPSKGLVSLGPFDNLLSFNTSKSIESRAMFLVSFSGLDHGLFEGG